MFRPIFSWNKREGYLARKPRENPMGKREWLLIIVLGVILGISAGGTFKVDLVLALPVGVVAVLILVFGFGRFMRRMTG